MPLTLSFQGPGGSWLGTSGPARFESCLAIIGPLERASRVARQMGSRAVATTAMVDESLDRPLKIAGRPIVVVPNLAAFRVRHIFPRFANWMNLVIQGAALEHSWHQEGPCSRSPEFGHLTNTKLACSALHYVTAIVAVMTLLSTYTLQDQ